MAKKLKVNFNELNATIANYEQAINEFESMKRGLENSINILRDSKWKSLSSKTYFESFDNTFSKNMDMHIKVLKHLKSCLEEAQKEYNEIYETIPTLGKYL